MLHGFSPPFTPAGRSSLVPSPPWHYAGWIYSVDYRLDPERAAGFLQDGFGAATGRATFHAADWQATTDGSELLDPAYAQYKECFVVLEVERAGELVNYCPLIYVDQDISLLRGWLQGLPKKLGSVWMTRSYGLDHPAAVPLRAGARLGATLAVKDRRLAETVLTLTGGEGRRLGFFARPTFGLIGQPSIIGRPRPARPVPVRMVAEQRVFGPSWACDAELRFLESPRDELHDLRPDHVEEAAVSSFAFTVTQVSEW